MVLLGAIICVVLKRLIMNQALHSTVEEHKKLEPSIKLPLIILFRPQPSAAAAHLNSD
jgi:hypothetical protein